MEEVDSGWTSPRIVSNYDKRRFSSIVGRISHALDKCALTRATRLVKSRTCALDIPCGTGRLTNILANMKFLSVIGADISPEMLTEARRRSYCGKVSFIQCNAQSTGLPLDSFDLIVSIRFIGHLDDPSLLGFFREARKIGNGYLVLENPRPNTVGGSIKRTVLRRFTMQSRLPTTFKWHQRTVNDLGMLATKNGWEIVKVVKKLPLLSDSVYVVFQ